MISTYEWRSNCLIHCYMCKSYINKWYESWNQDRFDEDLKNYCSNFCFCGNIIFSSILMLLWCFGSEFVFILIIFQKRMDLYWFENEISWFEWELRQNWDFWKKCVLEIFDQFDGIIVRFGEIAFVKVVCALISSRLV